MSSIYEVRVLGWTALDIDLVEYSRHTTYVLGDMDSSTRDNYLKMQWKGLLGLSSPLDENSSWVFGRVSFIDRTELHLVHEGKELTQVKMNYFHNLSR